jgi:hypothetical protein
LDRLVGDRADCGDGPERARGESLPPPSVTSVTRQLFRGGGCLEEHGIALGRLRARAKREECVHAVKCSWPS